MANQNIKKLVEDRIISRTEFKLKPDEKHLLIQVFESYFRIQEWLDEMPRPRSGPTRKRFEDLQKTAKTFSKCIDSLENREYEFLTVLAIRDRNDAQVLEQLRNDALWLSKTAEKIVNELASTKDKGGAKKELAPTILIRGLMYIYRMATGKEPRSSSAYKDREGRYRIGPFGRFVKTCLDVLEPPRGIPAIAKLIRATQILFPESKPPKSKRPD